MASKPLVIYDLKKWALDDGIHIDFREIDGYDKIFNFIVCSRSAGKSCQLWKKIYNRFKKTGNPSIVLRRKQVDITPQYIEDIGTLINKFTNADLELSYKMGDIKQGGMMDVKLNGQIFFRIIALATPMSRLKSMVLRHVAYIINDEFICNIRDKEKYEENEVMKFQEIYNTYNREADQPIKCYFCGNPYSLFNPYFTWKGVDTRKLKKGALQVGSNWLVWCYELKQELKDYLMKTNPLYEDPDSDYVKYAFNGESVFDQHIQLINAQPQGFRLRTVFKIHDQLVGIFKDYEPWARRPVEEVDVKYWAKVMKPEEIGANRSIFVFDFSQMMDQSILVNRLEKLELQDLKEAIQYREIAYKTIDASYFLEEIYANI